MRSRVGPIVGVVLLVAVVVGIVALSSGEGPVPFRVNSSAPDGYRAVRILLENQGAEVRSMSASDAFGEDAELSPADTVVVAVPSWLSPEELAAAEDLARSGATVVLAGDTEFFYQIDERALKREPAFAVARGFCDIAGLEDLAEIDAIDSAVTSGELVCFGDATGAQVAVDATGDGSVVRLASPYLWANARLQPDKEEGGRALDNGPMAVALLGGSATVTFVDAVPTPGVSPDGTRSPLALMPLGVQLAIAQAVGAFVLYAWWKGRRLGRPVQEVLPVEVAGSEIVEATGGLLRRGGSPARAAEILRAELRHTLSSRLGLPPDAADRGLVAAVAARTGRPPEEVAAILVHQPVRTADDLVALTRSLDQIRTEVLDGQLT